MKRKLFTLLTLLLTVCSGAWADSYVGKNTETAGTIIYYNNNSSGSNQSLTTEIDDNGIYSVSGTTSLKKGPDVISVADNALLMICVDNITDGTVSITMSGTGTPKAPDWSSTDGGSDGRYFQLYIENTAAKKFLYSKYADNAEVKGDDDSGLTYVGEKIRGLRSFDFTSSDLTTVGERKYLKFKAIGGEMKPYGFKIVSSADMSKPTFSLTNPAATLDVAITSRTVVLTASEAIFKVDTDVSGTLKIGTADATAINYVYDGSANTLSYTFSGDLGYSTTYAFTVNANQVQDAAGNKNDATSAFSFTTEANVPAVITSVTPNGGAVNGGASVSVDADGTVYHQWSDNSTATVGVGEWSNDAITVPNEAGTKYLHVYAYKTEENLSAITTKEFTVKKVASVVTKVWDFTKALSATDIANLKADNTNWSWTEASDRYANKANLTEGAVIKANAVTLEKLEGLTFSAFSSADRLRINNGSYLQMNGSDYFFTIPSLAVGDVVSITYLSASSSDDNRSWTTPSNARRSSAEGTQTINGKNETTPKTVEYTITSAGNTQFKQSKGLNIKRISISKIVPVVEVPVTDYGWATFNCDQALDLTNVDFAYQVKGVSGSAVTLEAVNEPVAANTPLLIKGTEGTPVTLNIPITTSSNTLDDNKLVAVTANTNVAKESGHWKYVLAVQDEKAVFAPINSDAASLNKGQAYLDLTEAPASARALSIGFNWDDETTGVQKIQSVESMANSCFNLAGQRVSKPMKGLYIVNGKKYLAK